MEGVAMSPIYDNSNDRQEFEEWLNKYNKHYDTEEEKEKRFKVFQFRKLALLKADPTGMLLDGGMNRFSDMTREEFKEMFPLISVYTSDDMTLQEFKEKFPGSKPVDEMLVTGKSKRSSKFQAKL